MPCPGHASQISRAHPHSRAAYGSDLANQGDPCPGSNPREQEAVIQAYTVDSAVERAILEAVAYADIFDFPLTAAEVHRYLVGVSAPRAVVNASLAALAGERLACREGFYTLPGRERLVQIRRRRAAVAGRLWPAAIRYGRIMAELPFVRMVAVTGSLALDNAEAESDIDFLVVTVAGRVWVGRGMAALLARLALRRGIRLCPNYVLSEQALIIEDRNLYTAHELTQMVPLVGYALYRRMLAINSWTVAFLPNARGELRGRIPERPRRHPLSYLAETALRTRVGSWLDRFERTRIQRKMLPRIENPAEVVYSAERCKAHRDAHGQRILAAFADRLESCPPPALLGCGGNGVL